jgi:Raf kinase inhibitor-like YbhB/YbcL family protein
LASTSQFAAWQPSTTPRDSEKPAWLGHIQKRWRLGGDFMGTRKRVIRVNTRLPLLILLALLGGLLAGCARDAALTDVPPTGGAATDFNITSPAFANGGAIPSKYTCDGGDISPPLQWTGPPPGTASLALIADDPDAPAGTWVHWVVYNLPADLISLPEAVPAGAELPQGGLHGQNSWKRTDYGGPCPPGGTHRYFFKLYALDTLLELNSGATKAQVLKAMQGHVLAQAELMGTYARK